MGGKWGPEWGPQPLSFPNTIIVRLKPKQTPEKFYEIVNSVKEGAEPRRSFPREGRLCKKAPSLRLFWRVRLPEGVKDVKDLKELVKKFAAHFDTVEDAALAGVPPPPPQSPAHMGPAPTGVDANHAHNNIPGGKGDGVKVCVCDYGFPMTLTGVNAVSHTGPQSAHPAFMMAVLSHLAGVHQILANICPGATMLSSTYWGDYQTECIEAAVDHLDPGDVLVLEMQTGVGSSLTPSEYDADFREAVRQAVNMGIVVVAAAGNGGINLTKTQADIEVGPTLVLKNIWNPASSDFDDSGAIIVGAGSSTTHSRLPSSNYGARVNCQGWGDGVANVSIGQTSLATAMVAGVVACLQGAARARSAPNNVHLVPSKVRELLRTHGTPPPLPPVVSRGVGTPPPPEHIGLLPDLKTLLENM